MRYPFVRAKTHAVRFVLVRIGNGKTRERLVENVVLQKFLLVHLFKVHRASH
jgi:hypothetical protein